MLKVAFPHLGNTYIVFRTLLRELGLDPVVPPPITQRTIARGTALAPEFACFPFKVNLGNYLEAIEAGAEAIFMAGGVGPCRFGYYGELQREILREAGHDLEFIVLEAPKTHPGELWQKLKRYFPRHKVADFLRAGHYAWLKAAALDRFDQLANHIRPIEVWLGTVNALQDKFYRQLDAAELAAEIKRIAGQALAELKVTAIRRDLQPLRIVMLGEIYMVLEPQANFDTERVLGSMGVRVERSIWFTEWLRDQLLYSIIKPNWRNAMRAQARPYLSNFVGGHGLETVAHTVGAGVNRYDGVVHVMPFTCMPEIVALQALPQVSRDLEIPVLSLILDEHAAEAGVRTRLEAFCDMLQYRKTKRNGGEAIGVLSGR
jgi:predicted nucleotide-binding protein (sugar kinase/HSP70/actin superfamily)